MAEFADLRLALPKGRMMNGVLGLLAEAGLPIGVGERDYRPSAPPAGMDVKLLKPQNIVEMLAAGSRDLGFAGADWVDELDAGLDEVLDTGLDPVRLVAAAPAALAEAGFPSASTGRRLRVASEYERITRRWMASRGLDAEFVRSYGATEAFPPDDADCIVDNSSSGATLRANGLCVVDELSRSTTRLYASRNALADPGRRERIEHLATLLGGVLCARSRVLLEVNVDPERLDALISRLPSMKEPTVSALRGRGYAVKVAAPRAGLPELIRDIRNLGGTDIVVSSPSQIMP